MKIAVLPGDGIGPEVIDQAMKVLDVLRREGMPLECERALIGGCAFDATGHPLPDATLALARSADAILFGAEGGFQYESLPRGLRPGDALLTLRRELDLFANFRPVVAFPELGGASPLKAAHVDGLDLMILRELTGDLYFGEPRGIVVEAGVRVGINTMRYDENEIRRIAKVGFETARKRRRRLCSVDKANVLESMELWREVVDEVARDYPDVELEHLYVDSAAMSLLRAPKQFDVIVTGNLFGDILSDEASMLVGSIGMLPSASLGAERRGLYEPVHGCAPDIAGRDIANPLASILSAAMMLRMSFDEHAAADRIERAVRRVLASGYRTADIVEPGTRRVGTSQMGDLVVAALS
ncbi:3-isopropylmalate dehydrogenase [Paraburkholderia caffeinilytica]|uniref:3-isopropylmalate dehydrogenase n=1 Tax=Paraburkholderia caffeinilytica TaxID=1761016 RepID=A0ABQ1LTF2_9BURK|nr:3-isopropylmalate dehydrogenase [Paraburkholderia caffeinilytica]AXL53451.1 3-isopropylmalate dehydrogenase [Paraburkholderia caffeinilytica]GGC29441.1 3-isopropylmalate dehydrogenase [Paraburkholderia caffeinilytica]CAB3781408.1 3-isopropylmalate dehydrogenase [Paraburkholderia caffeinilytica]